MIQKIIKTSSISYDDISYKKSIPLTVHNISYKNKKFDVLSNQRGI